MFLRAAKALYFLANVWKKVVVSVRADGTYKMTGRV